MNIYSFKRIVARALFLVLLAIISPSGSFANEAAYNRAFANFIKLVFVNTETVKKGGKLCVFGSDGVSLQLSSSFKSGKIEDLGDSVITSKNYGHCRLIYVAKNKQRVVKRSINPLNASTALTIAIFPTFVHDGGMVSVGVGRRNFELTVNTVNFKKSGVKLDSAITGLIVEGR